ncbi:hypothetical protein [Desulfobacula toluolica]|uniref:Conserved uncharacterized protein n=1 Tax=Desulfobacula toluolica (strain DSM 7467 / Tol2) TaxID=651182 RepID=K0N2Y9_DESTT|nr:hypothetical protein [Desulfobacula toluolica]CCK78484.1 conserved uncharacterized protein [Desulfobacula toluolica Tol2]
MIRKHLLVDVIAGLIVAGLVVILAGCGEGLPKNLKNRARAIPDAIKTGKSQIDKHKDQYETLAASSEFKEVEPFALKENWAQKFQLAYEELTRAKTLYDKDLSPLVGKNKPELASQVIQQTVRIKKVLKNAENLSRYPILRFAKIRNTIENAADLQSGAQKNTDDIIRIATALKTGSMAKAIADFPDLTDKINTRFAPLSKLERQSRKHLSVVTEQYKRHAAGSTADYAAFTDSVESLDSGLEQTKILETKFIKEMGQLYSSYTKILKDMKEEYFVNIKRESWNENSDYYDPRFVNFYRKVSPEAYETLTADNLDTIAAISAGLGTGVYSSRFSSQIGDLWKQLSINPTDQWPESGHNAASFWVESSREAYFHKYILEENGDTKETDWEKVDANFYDANLEYLGMAVLAKPYGVFEQDRLTQAAPPGMAYVGNSKYGEWKKDDTGNQFWSWYGKYALFSSLFFFPPSYFHYNSWNSWNNDYRYKKPYFGQTKNGSRKYGTYGTYVRQSPKFQSTNFAKSGGFKSQATSVRGAGAGLRGGGPKSKGK